MKNTAVIFLLLGIIAHLCGAAVNYAHLSGECDFLKDEKIATTAFMMCDISFKFCLSFAFYVYYLTKEKNELLNYLLQATVAFIFNDILDEFFFDPFHWQMNETVLLILILTTGIYRLCKATMTFTMRL